MFALRCYVAAETPADETAYRPRPLKVHVLVTGDYLLTLHGEQVSLPAVLAPDLPEERSKRYVVYSVLDAMLASTRPALIVGAAPTGARDRHLASACADARSWLLKKAGTADRVCLRGPAAPAASVLGVPEERVGHLEQGAATFRACFATAARQRRA